jgi:hypothetical protein
MAEGLINILSSSLMEDEPAASCTCIDVDDSFVFVCSEPSFSRPVFFVVSSSWAAIVVFGLVTLTFWLEITLCRRSAPTSSTAAALLLSVFVVPLPCILAFD